MTVFEQCFAIVVGEEGGLDTTWADRGNWTSGIPGIGRRNGTKFGVSAHAYPTLDIAGLTLDDAHAIYQRDYWAATSCDKLPPRLAFLVFDSAVNNGPSAACVLLQRALGVTEDGIIGMQTLAALRDSSATSAGLDALCAEFEARRMIRQFGLVGTFVLGWARRIAAQPYRAMTITA